MHTLGSFKTVLTAGLGLLILFLSTYTAVWAHAEGLMAKTNVPTTASIIGARAKLCAYVTGDWTVIYNIPLGLIPTPGTRLWWSNDSAVVELPNTLQKANLINASDYISLASQEKSLGTFNGGRFEHMKLPEENINKVQSYTFRLNEKEFNNIFSPYFPIDSLLLRKQPTSQYSLSVVVNVPNSELPRKGLYTARKIISLSSSALAKMNSQKYIHRIELDYITADEVRSSAWTLKSCTDALLEDDEKGFLVLTGTIEIVLGLTTEKVNANIVSASSLLADGGQFAIPNFGDGAKLRIGQTKEPVILVNSDGTLVSSQPGQYINIKGKWFDEKLAKEKAGVKKRKSIK